MAFIMLDLQKVRLHCASCRVRVRFESWCYNASQVAAAKKTKLEEPGQNSGSTIIGYSSRIAASPGDIVKEVRSSFLSDPSPIIGNACQWLTDSLTNSCLVNLIDVTLACEDANSKLVEVVTVADVDAEDNVGKRLLQIWELMFGPKAKLLFRLWAQG